MKKRVAHCVFVILIIGLLSGCTVAEGQGVDFYTDRLTVDGIRIAPSAYGEMYLSAPATTAIATPGTYYKVEGTEAYDELHDMYMAGDALEYTGDYPRYFLVNATMSIEVSSPLTVVTWAIAINDVPHGSGYVATKVSTAGDVQDVSSVNILELYPGDHIELYATADKAITLTTNYLILTAVSLN